MPMDILPENIKASCVKKIQTNDWEGLRKDAQLAVIEIPGQPHGLVWLTLAEWHLGNHENAKSLADQTVLKFPNSAWVWENQAKIASLAKDWHLASRLWQGCADRFPRPHSTYVEGSKAYLHLGENRKAIRLLEKGVALFPNNWHLLTTQAKYYEQQADLTQALRLWLELDIKFPQNKFVRKKAIEIFEQMQDHVGAFKFIMNWIQSGVDTMYSDYSLAANAFIRAFDELDLYDERIVKLYWELINQPTNITETPTVSALALRLQYLSAIDAPKYKKIIQYTQDFLGEETTKTNSIAREFSLAIGVPGLILSETELIDLISDTRFCSFFSDYIPHVDNVKSLNNFLEKNTEKQFLDNLPEAGLKNLHLFAAASPIFNECMKKCILERLNLSGLGKRKLALAYNTNKVRIAVCISGQLRGYKTAFKTWKNLGLDMQDTHYFVHSWYDIGQKFPLPGNPSRSFSGNFLSKLLEASKSFSIEKIRIEYPSLYNSYQTSSVTNETDVAKFYSSDSVVLEDDTIGRFSAYSNPMKMFYKIQKAWDLAVESGKDYDLIIRTRPDKPLGVKNDVDWGEVYRTCSKTATVYTDIPFRLHYDSNLIVGDQFAISTPDIMEHYSQIYSSSVSKNGDTEDPSEYRHTHRRMANTLHENGIVARQNPFIVPGLPLDPEKLSSTKILALMMRDIDQRTATHLDKTLIAALQADIRSQKSCV